MFLSGFLISRQLRIFENVLPQISNIFIQHKLLLSVVTGISAGGLFTAFLALRESLITQIFVFAALSVISSVSYYVGTTIGWKRST